MTTQFATAGVIKVFLYTVGLPKLFHGTTLLQVDVNNLSESEIALLTDTISNERFTVPQIHKGL
jgi:hypothetical protein